MHTEQYAWLRNLLGSLQHIADGSFIDQNQRPE